MAAALLLVDDDPGMTTVVGLLGRRGGHAVAVAADVATAWSELAARRPDLVLLDVNLPGASGLELLRRVRLAPEVSSLPVGLFCQPELSGDVAAGWAAGADYLIPKGLVTDPRWWQARLGAVLAHAAGRRPPRLVGWPDELFEVPPPTWSAALKEALGRPPARPLGTEVLAQVLARALRCSFGPEAVAAFLLPNVARLAPAFPRPASAGRLRGFVDSVADQLWCLLGEESARAFEGAVRAALVRG